MDWSHFETVYIKQDSPKLSKQKVDKIQNLGHN